MNPLLLLAIFGGGAYAYTKSKKKTKISYPTESGTTANAPTSTASTTTKKVDLSPVPWVQPNYSLSDFTRSTWYGIKNVNGNEVLMGPGDVLKAPLLAAQDFISTRDPRSQELVNGVLTVSEAIFDSFLSSYGYDGNTDSRKLKSEVFVLIPQIANDIQEFHVNLRNGGVAISRKVYNDQVRSIITGQNASSVVMAVPNEAVLNNNVGIRVPFAAFRNISKGVPDGAYQMIVYNTIEGNAIMNVSAPDASGKRTYTLYKTL